MMNVRTLLLLSGASFAVAACAGTPSTGVEITRLSPDALPAEVRAQVDQAETGLIIAEAQKKVRAGRTYYDVEAQRPDGSEIEFDILMTPAGPQIVELQRDLYWEDVPEAVRAAAASARQGAVPERVIESTQTDGVIIYELFAPGAPADPAMEVSLSPAGEVTVLAERWPH